MSNVGKIFETDFKKSVPDYCLLTRIPDPPQSFTQRSDTKFSNKNPYDFTLFDCKNRTLFCVELKTTHYKSMSFEDINSDEKQNKMVHKHQILGLKKASEYENVIAGFFFNFRDDNNNVERTYFQNIKDFLKMTKEINKQSFNEMDLILYKSIKVNGVKKRVHYSWNVEEFLNNMNKNIGGN